MRIKMDWWLWLLIGAGSGAGGVSIYHLLKPPPPPVIVREEVAKEQIQVQKNLTATDILEVPCSTEFIKEHSYGLCRELYCRMTTRGIDSKTSGQECEDISNVNNKTAIMLVCKHDDIDRQKACLEYFDRRL